MNLDAVMKIIKADAIIDQLTRINQGKFINSA